MNTMKMHAFRIKPNQDLKVEIEKFIKDQNIRAGYIATCVASLKSVTIRMAGAKPNEQDIQTFNGEYELVSLVGTVSKNGSHLHISVSDKNGQVIGGHLKAKTLVRTTAEIIIMSDETINFERILDPETGFDELTVT